MARRKRELGYLGLVNEDDDPKSEALSQALNDPLRRVDWGKLILEVGPNWEEMVAKGNVNSSNQAIIILLIARLGEQVSDLQDELRRIAPE